MTSDLESDQLTAEIRSGSPHLIECGRSGKNAAGVVACVSKRVVLGMPAFAATLCFSLFSNAQPPAVPAKESNPKTAPAAKPADEKLVTVEEARERARLMHDIYSATLDALHHHFFRHDLAVLPARAMEDVFAEVDEKQKIKSRWIAVNTPAMSVNHEPANAFEKKAAEEIASGKAEYELVENGYYKRPASSRWGTGASVATLGSCRRRARRRRRGSRGW